MSNLSFYHQYNTRHTQNQQHVASIKIELESPGNGDFTVHHIASLLRVLLIRAMDLINMRGITTNKSAKVETTRLTNCRKQTVMTYTYSYIAISILSRGNLALARVPKLHNL